MNLRDDITKVLADVTEDEFKFVRLNAYEEILERIADRFLIDGARDLRFVWLWERFRHDVSWQQPDDVFPELEKRLRAGTRYWFLASDEHGRYWVADACGSGILAVLREMYGFEYYIVDRRMTWMLCENHHGLLMEASSSPITL